MATARPFRTRQADSISISGSSDVNTYLNADLSHRRKNGHFPGAQEEGIVEQCINALMAITTFLRKGFENILIMIEHYIDANESLSWFLNRLEEVFALPINTLKWGLATPFHIAKWWFSVIWDVTTYPIRLAWRVPRNLIAEIKFQFETKIEPLIESFFNLFPDILQWQWPTYFIPYNIWHYMLQHFGSPEQKATRNALDSELARVTAQLAKASEEKNQLLDVSIQNRALQKENDSLKEQLKASVPA